MNQSEELVREFLMAKGHDVRKLHGTITDPGIPDFIVNESFYVEVKTDKPTLRNLSTTQQRRFAKLTRPIYIYYVSNQRIWITPYRVGTIPEQGVRRITEPFTDEEHAALTKAKEAAGMNWHDFIMTLARRNP